MGDPSTFVCQVDALDAIERVRQKQLVERLSEARLGMVELDDGWLFELRPDDETFAAAAEWVTYEGRCCPFIRFVLEWRGDGNIGVRLTGAPGAKAFITETFASLRP